MSGFSRHAGLVFLLCALCCAVAAQADGPATLDLHKVFGTEYACAVPRPVQFVAEDELVVLAGPTSNCFEHVDELELVALSLEGRVLARRKWSSTDSGIVVVPERLAFAIPGGVEMLDANLKTVQVLRAGPKRDIPVIAATDIGILSVSTETGTTTYSGTPLRTVQPAAAAVVPGSAALVSTLDGSWELLRQGNSLVEARAGAKPRTFADLSWVAPPCEDNGICQADETTTRYQAVLGRRNRILITSTGAHLPVQGSFGLLPYFRVQVFDLGTGAEVYREEDLFGARNRLALLSPGGDVLVIIDGYTAMVHRLQ